MGWRGQVESQTKELAIRQTEMVAKLLRVYRAARAVTANAGMVDRGIYQIKPDEMLALRIAVERAGAVVSREAGK